MTVKRNNPFDNWQQHATDKVENVDLMQAQPSPNFYTWLALLLKVGGRVAILLLPIFAIALVWAHGWAKHNLAPIIAKELSKSLKRPVNLGEISDLSINGLRFIDADIPATANDRDRVEVKEIVVNFDPIKLALSRTLKLNIKLIEPNLYIDRDTKGNWVNIPPQEPTPPGAIKTEIGTIEIAKARATLVPDSQNPQATIVRDINAIAEVDDPQQQVSFDGMAQVGEGGRLQIKGNSLIINGQTKLVINGKKLKAVDVSNLIQIPAVKIDRGSVDGNLELQVNPQQNLRLLGNVLVNNAQIAIDNVPRSFDRTNGWLQVSDRDVKFSNVTTNYGKVAGLVNGTIDFNKGYQLTAKTARTQLPDLLKTLDIVAPVPISGEAAAEVKLTGKLDRPILAGKYVNTQLTQIDRVQFNQINGDFTLADGRIKLNTNAEPRLGGEIQSYGEIKLLKNPQLRFQFQGKNLPADSYTQLYGTQLPPEITIGNTTLLGTAIGTGNNLQTNIHVKVPQATYPAVADINIDNRGVIRIDNGEVKIAGDRLKVKGELRDNNWQFNLVTNAIDSLRLAEIAGAKIPAFYRGKLAANLQVKGAIDNTDLDSIQVGGRANLQTKAGKITAENIQVAGGKWQVLFSINALNLPDLDPNLPTAVVRGKFQINGDSLQNFDIAKILVQGRGEANINGNKIQADNLIVSQGIWQGLFTTNNLELSQFNPQVKGKLSGKFNLTGAVAESTLDGVRGEGTGVISLPQGKVIAKNVQIDRGQWRGQIALNRLKLGGFSDLIPSEFKAATVDGNFNMAGNLKQLDAKHINVAGSGRLKLGEGVITARQLQLAAGKWGGDFNLDRWRLGNVTDNIPVGLASAILSGDFRAAGEIDKLTPDRVQLIGNGRLNIGGGIVTAQGVELANANWRGKFGFKDFNLGAVTSQLPSQFKGAKLTGNFNLAGNLTELDPSTIQGNGAGEIAFRVGSIRATDLRLDSGQMQANVGIRGLKLGTVNNQLPLAIQTGKLNGNFQVSANLQELQPERVELLGEGDISDLLGGNVRLQDIALSNGQWQGKLTANRLNLATLAQFSPRPLPPGQITGNLSGSWEMAGNLREPNPAKIRAIGTTKLTNFRVGAIKFEPTLIGNVQANPGQGVDVSLSGDRDRVAITLDRTLQPQTFAVRQGEVVASGTIGDKILNVKVESLPIALLKPWIPKNAGISQYRLEGNATGNLALNLRDSTLAGNQITITNPAFGGFKGDRLVLNFQATGKQVRLNDTELEVANNRYLLNGTFDPTAKTPTFQAKLTVPQGRLTDLRDLLQIYSVADLLQPFNQRQYGTAADLRLPRGRVVGKEQYSLNYELQRLSELRRWLEREAERQEADPIPDLRRLQGDFAGEIDLASNSKTGLKANFNISGKNWQLDRYHLDTIEARGKWQNNQLALDPLALTADQSQIILRGDFGLDRQTAQVEIRNLPTAWVTTFVPLPVDVDGGLNINAEIGGNWQNPQVEGKIALINGQLNQTRLQSADANFNYQNGRLDFDSRATFTPLKDPTDTDPIKITGSIPYQFPLAQQPPPNRALNIDLNLRDRGLQIIDVLSNKQLQWIDGEGAIDLRVTGKMGSDGKIQTLSANGIAMVDRARIQSAALPEPLTNVMGRVVFDFDRLDVQQLEAKFGRGQVQAAGILPISDPNAIDDPTRRLQVAMKGLTVNLPEKYQGNVDGELQISGTALNPILGGKVQLSQGKVLLPDAPAVTATSIPTIRLKSATETATNSNPNSTELRNLQVTLGDDLQISRPPLLNFVATGTLDIDGTIDEPRPFGQVTLTKGLVNLFTTQFRLANGYPQTADFFPTLGSDPVLNLRLFAKTLESTASPLTQRNSIARTPVGSEINETANFYGTSLGSVQTIQVEARISGLASQITQRLELTSTPPRTQAEIVLLLGGGLVERLAAGDNNLGLGIANFASSTLLNNLQDQISDALSLSDFRLFPTITPDTNKSNTSTFGIAAELGMEITPKLSTSVLKILTNSELPQYGLRYRLNDQILLRGSTNLSGENRAILEFEQRF